MSVSVCGVYFRLNLKSVKDCRLNCLSKLDDILHEQL